LTGSANQPATSVRWLERLAKAQFAVLFGERFTRAIA